MLLKILTMQKMVSTLPTLQERFIQSQMLIVLRLKDSILFPGPNLVPGALEARYTCLLS